MSPVGPLGMIFITAWLVCHLLVVGYATLVFILERKQETISLHVPVLGGILVLMVVDILLFTMKLTRSVYYWSF